MSDGEPHDPCSPRIADPCPEDERGLANPTRDLRFFESTGSGPSGPLQLLRPKPAHAPNVLFLRWPSLKRPGRFPPLAVGGIGLQRPPWAPSRLDWAGSCLSASAYTAGRSRHCVRSTARLLPTQCGRQVTVRMNREPNGQHRAGTASSRPFGSAGVINVRFLTCMRPLDGLLARMLIG